MSVKKIALRVAGVVLLAAIAGFRVRRRCLAPGDGVELHTGTAGGARLHNSNRGPGVLLLVLTFGAAAAGIAVVVQPDASWARPAVVVVAVLLATVVVLSAVLGVRADRRRAAALDALTRQAQADRPADTDGAS